MIDIPRKVIEQAVEHAKIEAKVSTIPGRIAIVYDDRPNYGFRMYSEFAWAKPALNTSIFPWAGPPRGGSNGEVFKPLAYVSADGTVEYVEEP